MINKLILITVLTTFNITPYQQGLASYYGEGNWHGSITANGEVFKPMDKTCASRTIAFDTILAIINKDNGRISFCRVNDRGPFDIVKGKPVVDLKSRYKRILDVSKGVATELQMLDKGIINVDIHIVGKP